MIDSVLIKVLCWDDFIDNLFFKLGLEILKSDIGAMLGRDKDGMYTERCNLSVLVFVLNRDLGLSVWANPWASSIFTDLSEFVSQLSGKRMRKRH